MVIDKKGEKYSNVCSLYNNIFYGIDNSSNGIPILSGINYTASESKIFKNKSWSKLLICHTDSASFDSKQFESLKKSCLNLDEQSLYLVHTELDSPILMPDFHEFSFDYVEYTANDTIRYNDNAIFSNSGKWGAFVAHEDFAVISGEQTFIENFKKNYPEWQDGFQNFIVMWEENSKEEGIEISWMKKFLKNLT